MDGRDAPEVVMHSDLEPYSDETANKSGMLSDYRPDQVMMVQEMPPPPPPKILGLRRSTFWLLVILAVVVVAAAVGGGVGGSMAVANARK